MIDLSDRVVGRLRDAVDRPDLTGTPYTIERELGRGGIGSVYEVSDGRLGRRVGLKVLTADDDPDRLLAEARVAANLEHPGVVPIYDAGVLKDGRAFYTMRVVEGAHLDEYARRHESLSDRLRVFQKLCDTMAFAHSRGVVHRDLKPANVMVGAFGEVLVMDWGVGMAGTPQYQAPEQTGVRTQKVNPPVDVYALGVILRALLPAKAPRALDAVATRATAADPGSRYGDAGELNMEIARYLDTGTVEAYREAPIERAVRFYKANQPLLVLFLAYVVVRFILFLY